MQAVAGTVSMLALPGGGNIGPCAGEDGLLVVDDHLVNQRDAVTAAIRSASKQAPHFLVNTHWHGDHTGSGTTLEHLQRLSEALAG